MVKKLANRSQYKTVWNALSTSEDDAWRVVSGVLDEDVNRKTANDTLGMLQTLVGIGKDDVVLEIGAGVGRVGAVVAPLCKEWIGTDVSARMIGHMRRRLAGLNNVRLVETNGYDLAAIPSESIDLVYCTVVFMHLDEWDRFGYVSEGFRVLRPGGRMLVDNVNLLSNDGWTFFEQHRAIRPSKRVPHLSRTSTPQELETYFQRAGFATIQHLTLAQWIVTYGRKPD